MNGLGTPELDEYQSEIDYYDALVATDAEHFRSLRRAGASEDVAAHLTDAGLVARYLFHKLGRVPTDDEVMRKLATI